MSFSAEFSVVNSFYLPENVFISLSFCLDGRKMIWRFKSWLGSKPREGNGTPFQYSCLENPMDGGVWWAEVHGVTKSRTRLQRLRFHFSLSCIGEGNGNPLKYSCLENPMDGEAWWAAVHGVARSRTRLSNFAFTFHFHELEKEMATHSSVLGVAQSRTRLK